jgi:DNA-binding response OmpR family regulator
MLDLCEDKMGSAAIFVQVGDDELGSEGGNDYTEGHRHAVAAVAKPIRRILIAEPEEDIQMLYRHCLDARGLELTIVSTGNKCLESVFNSIDNEGFDIIILDTHLKDISGIEIARMIKQRLQDQRIIITSTTVSANDMKRLGIIKDDILKKPFRFYKLLSLIRSEK